VKESGSKNVTEYSSAKAFSITNPELSHDKLRADPTKVVATIEKAARNALAAQAVKEAAAKV
jgi:hypothetical protein